MKAKTRAYDMAGRIGQILEGEGIQDSGIALGMVLGQFILLLEKTDSGISEGIDAIASDAKDVAKRLRNMRQ